MLISSKMSRDCINSKRLCVELISNYMSQYMNARCVTCPTHIPQSFALIENYHTNESYTHISRLHIIGITACNRFVSRSKSEHILFLFPAKQLPDSIDRLFINIYTCIPFVTRTLSCLCTPSTPSDYAAYRINIVDTNMYQPDDT